MTQHCAHIAKLQQEGMDFLANGEYAQAEPLLREAHRESLANHDKTNDVATHGLEKRLAQSLLGQEKFEEAEPLVHKSARWFQQHYGPDDEDTLDCQCLVVEVLYHKHKFPQAEELARSTLDLLMANLKRGPEHATTLKCGALLALILKEENRYQQATEVAKKNDEGIEAVCMKAEKLESMGSRRMSHTERFALEQADALNNKVLGGEVRKISKETVSTQGSMPGSRNHSKETQ